MYIEHASFLSLEDYINNLASYIGHCPDGRWAQESRDKLDGAREALEILGIALVENEHGYIECKEA